MVPPVFDFPPEFIDFNKMLDEPLAWQVANGEFFTIDNMRDDELLEAIIDDVLCVTIWEKQSGKVAEFGVATLCRYLTHDQRVRVMEAMKHPILLGLFHPETTERLRIVDDRDVLQAAMKFAGVWFHGYDCPAGVVSVDRQALQDAMDANGGLDNLIDGLVMDLTATHSPTSVVH